MDRISRGARNRRGALHHFRVMYSPFVGLLGTHGAADNQRETRQAKFFRDKFLLCPDVITDADMRKIPHPSRRRRVVRRGGKAVANLVDDDDEILVGIERATLPDIHLLHDLACAGVPGRNEDCVIFGGAERTKTGVSECAAANSAAFFQLQITNIEQLVWAVHFLRVVAISDHSLPVSSTWRGKAQPVLPKLFL